MSISSKDVATVAHLARLELKPEQIESLTGDLKKILEHVETLTQLETSDVPPTTQVAVDAAPLRSDENQPSLDKGQVLAQAPRADEVGFLVPGFVDES